ncbi:SWIM zinc finger family protein [Saccharothrix australiensis]|uniref:Putative Zn finger protein n=1 Tax=Saccharothrix australiensis TaxID=2072 RepID=A0A495W5G1_9PSEU|nr:SWIM zinc finger family protein [Saccharothrix australiensis]RKT55058.1 putative Zn finger protein [Saccharothrix australiensis]
MTERVKGFPAFGKGVRHARSWWGRAWLQAVEDTSLDQAPLRQGRKYAHAGLVGTITVSPGLLSAAVHDTDDIHRTTVRLTPFTDAEWRRLLDQVAAKTGHLAALFDGEVPRELAEAADDAGVRLLPGIGDLDPDCTCPGWELPCRHAAALCHQASWLLDADPWVLLLLRGRAQAEVVAGARPRTGVLAADAHARPPVELPEDPPPAEPGPPPEFDPAPGLDVAVLALLVADAADKARELLRTGELPALDERADRVRLAAAHPALADRLGAGDHEIAAWRQGGPAGLAVLDDAWTPAGADAARARAAWAGGELPAAKVWRNRWTVRDRQLRYGRDGRWYPYRYRAGRWRPAGTADRDPAAAFAELA